MRLSLNILEKSMKKEMKALIDGDVLVYWSANWGQTNYFDVVNSEGDVLDSRESKRFAQDSANDLMDFSEEELKVEAGDIRLTKWKSCVEFIDNFIAKIVRDAQCESFEIHLSGLTNFRKEIGVTKPYKGNRSSEKPYYYNKVRDYLTDKYDVIVSIDEEADDTLAIAQTKDPDGTCICTVDKDLWMVPGNKYNFRKEEASYVTEFDGMRAMQFQMLTGDSVDNIPGVPKIGKVGAEKLLAAHPEIDDAWVAIAEAYKKSYGNSYKCIMVEMGRLLWMRRVENEMWSLPQILLERKGEI